jgi:hypothetical protein
LLFISIYLFLGLGFEATVGSGFLLLDQNTVVGAVNFGFGATTFLGYFLRVEVIQEVDLILSKLVGFVSAYIVPNLGEIRGQN